jgi:hypothetical protein
MTERKRRKITGILLLAVLLTAVLAAAAVCADHHRHFDHAVSIQSVPADSLARLDSLAWEVETATVGEYIDMTGWALPLGRKLDDDLQVGLYREDTGTFIGMTTFFQQRKDINSRYGTGRYSYLYCGFQSRIRADQVNRGVYSVMLIFGKNKFYDTGYQITVGGQN